MKTTTASATLSDRWSYSANYNWRVGGSSVAELNLSFDINNSSTVNDYSDNSNDGTLGLGTSSMKPAWNSSGISGGCYEFDGQGAGNADFISHTVVPCIKCRNLFFSVWVYHTGNNSASRAGSYANVFDQGWASPAEHGMVIWDDVLKFDYYNGSWTSKSGSISQNAWTHVVGINDQGTLTLYING